MILSRKTKVPTNKNADSTAVQLQPPLVRFFHKTWDSDTNWLALSTHLDKMTALRMMNDDATELTYLINVTASNSGEYRDYINHTIWMISTKCQTNHGISWVYSDQCPPASKIFSVGLVESHLQNGNGKRFNMFFFNAQLSKVDPAHIPILDS